MRRTRIRDIADARFMRYLSVGCVNTLVGLSVIYFCMYGIGMNNIPANLLGYAVGVVVSFMLNRDWTFAHHGPFAPALVRFLVVLCVAYLANLVTVMVLAERVGVNRFLAQAAGTVPYTLVGYLGSRWFVFNAREATG
jgi:putative flippase GtrA